MPAGLLRMRLSAMPAQLAPVAADRTFTYVRAPAFRVIAQYARIGTVLTVPKVCALVLQMLAKCHFRPPGLYRRRIWDPVTRLARATSFSSRNSAMPSKGMRTGAKKLSPRNGGVATNEPRPTQTRLRQLRRRRSSPTACAPAANSSWLRTEKGVELASEIAPQAADEFALGERSHTAE
jgi:hypothetical protein